MASGGFRRASGGRIDRSKPVTFYFDGKKYRGYDGDTLASALLANGVHLSGRSFKYHRPRGIMSAGVEETNALVELRQGGRRDPNVRATTIPLYDGLVANSQNRWPSLKFDLMSINQLAGKLISAGFYYKTFMGPTRRAWMVYEYFIRHAAGLGKPPKQRDPDRYEKVYGAYDVMVVGSGPSGLSAARAAAKSGARTLLVEQEPVPGGQLLNETDGSSTQQWLEAMLEELQSFANLDIKLNTTAFGAYDHGSWGLLEDCATGLAKPTPHEARQRLWMIHAKRTVVATGAIERPFAFENNDRPGIMLANATRCYVNRYGVKPGSRAVIAGNNDSAIAAALDLATAGLYVTYVDCRATLDDADSAALSDAGIAILLNSSLVEAKGRLRVNSVVVAMRQGESDVFAHNMKTLDCDLIGVSGGWSPVVHLVSQRGEKPHYDEALAAYLVEDRPVDGLHTTGSAAGQFALSDCITTGHKAGREAAKAVGYTSTARAKTAKAETRFQSPWGTPLSPLWGVRSSVDETPAHAFVDLQHDASWTDLELAHREGFVSPEHLKRYTTQGMATDQGKTSNVMTLGLLAKLDDAPLSDVGTTTFRPPYTPVAIGAFAADAVGAHFKPVRRTPMHHWHEAAGAPMTEVGLWLRAWYYPLGKEEVGAAYVREMSHVRRHVGIADVSTLGKIAVQGPDAAEFLNRVYTNGFAKLPVGKVRYGLMLRDDGFVWDDGVTARLGEDDFFMTTTSANAGPIMDWLEYLLQTAWQDLKVHVTSITDQWAGMVISGASSRALLEGIATGCNVADDKLPHMGIGYGQIDGIDVRIHRMSYSGELAFEIFTKADFGTAVWEALITAGERFNLKPYGLESLAALRIEKGHVAGQELNGRTTLRDLGLTMFASKKKNYVGKILADRDALLDPNRPQLVGLEAPDEKSPIDGGMMLFGEEVEAIGEAEGEILSVTFSPVRGRMIALALLERGMTREGEIVQAVNPLEKRKSNLKVVSPHFYDPKGDRMYA